ncbi:hypothetical protein ABZT49_30590 [Methylobacterium sp. EM32]|uniref:hypothetical protein n=1 Tax=Methylobacterium sp. EM32 TaxID=3163481 RepID=UPI0033B0465B
MSDGVFDSGRRPNLSRDHDAVHAGGVSIRRLREIESLLGVSIDPGAGAAADGAMTFERQAIDLLRAFGRITDPATRREVLRLVTAMAPREGRD